MPSPIRRDVSKQRSPPTHADTFRHAGKTKNPATAGLFVPLIVQSAHRELQQHAGDQFVDFFDQIGIDLSKLGKFG
jgi:hypothetical protein